MYGNIAITCSSKYRYVENKSIFLCSDIMKYVIKYTEDVAHGKMHLLFQQ